jgi:hypothetical protein
VREVIWLDVDGGRCETTSARDGRMGAVVVVLVAIVVVVAGEGPIVFDRRRRCVWIHPGLQLGELSSPSIQGTVLCSRYKGIQSPVGGDGGRIVAVPMGQQ